jgi:hypothetical protein
MVLNFGDVRLGFFQLLAWHEEFLCDIVEVHVWAVACAQPSRQSIRAAVAEASRRSSRDLSHLEAEQKKIAAAASRASEVPLCVDLDGTLVRTDVAWECILSLFKSQPLALFLLPL